MLKNKRHVMGACSKPTPVLVLPKPYLLIEVGCFRVVVWPDYYVISAHMGDESRHVYGELGESLDSVFRRAQAIYATMTGDPS